MFLAEIDVKNRRRDEFMKKHNYGRGKYINWKHFHESHDKWMKRHRLEMPRAQVGIALFLPREEYPSRPTLPNLGVTFTGRYLLPNETTPVFTQTVESASLAKPVAPKASKRPREAEKTPKGPPAKKKQVPSVKPPKTAATKASPSARGPSKSASSKPTRLKDALAELNRLKGLLPEVVEEVSSSSGDDDLREVDGYIQDRSLETEVEPPPLRRTPLSYGVQSVEKKKEKVTAVTPPPSRTTAAPAPASAPTFDASAALARARQLLQGFHAPAFGSGSASAVSGEATEAAKKQLIEFLEKELEEVIPHQSAINSAVSTLLSSGVSLVGGLELSWMADLDRPFSVFSLAEDDLEETKSYFSKVDSLKTDLHSALTSADHVQEMNNKSQEASVSADAAVAELKAMLQQALDHQKSCHQQAKEHADILNDAGYQVDLLAKEFADLQSKKIVMQTRQSEAEARLQKVRFEWSRLRAAVRPSAAVPTPQEVEEQDDSLPVASLGKEFDLPLLEPLNGADVVDHARPDVPTQLETEVADLPDAGVASGSEVEVTDPVMAEQATVEAARSSEEGVA